AATFRRDDVRRELSKPKAVEQLWVTGQDHDRTAGDATSLREPRSEIPPNGGPRTSASPHRKCGLERATIRLPHRSLGGGSPLAGRACSLTVRPPSRHGRWARSSRLLRRR